MSFNLLGKGKDLLKHTVQGTFDTLKLKAEQHHLKLPTLPTQITSAASTATDFVKKHTPETLKNPYVQAGMGAALTLAGLSAREKHKHLAAGMIVAGMGTLGTLAVRRYRRPLEDAPNALSAEDAHNLTIDPLAWEPGGDDQDDEPRDATLPLVTFPSLPEGEPESLGLMLSPYATLGNVSLGKAGSPSIGNTLGGELVQAFRKKDSREEKKSEEKIPQVNAPVTHFCAPEPSPEKQAEILAEVDQIVDLGFKYLSLNCPEAANMQLELAEKYYNPTAVNQESRPLAFSERITLLWIACECTLDKPNMWWIERLLGLVCQQNQNNHTAFLARALSWGKDRPEKEIAADIYRNLFSHNLPATKKMVLEMPQPPISINDVADASRAYEHKQAYLHALIGTIFDRDNPETWRKRYQVANGDVAEQIVCLQGQIERLKRQESAVLDSHSNLDTQQKSKITETLRENMKELREEANKKFQAERYKLLKDYCILVLQSQKHKSQLYPPLAEVMYLLTQDLPELAFPLLERMPFHLPLTSSPEEIAFNVFNSQLKDLLTSMNNPAAFETDLRILQNSNLKVPESAEFSRKREQVRKLHQEYLNPSLPAYCSFNERLTYAQIDTLLDLAQQILDRCNWSRPSKDAQYIVLISRILKRLEDEKAIIDSHKSLKEKRANIADSKKYRFLNKANDIIPW